MTGPSRTLELRAEMLTALEDSLRAATVRLSQPPQLDMGAMVSYHFGWDEAESGAAGKRIRPLLTMLACSAAGGAWRTALPAATAVELIHNFSLIHDDIEDGSYTRRGRPTMWTRWNLAQALNTGDALLILSQSTAHELRRQDLPPERVLAVLETLNDACLQLTIGQHLDLAFEDRTEVSIEDYMTMIRGKTASLLAAATAVGALIAGADEDRLSAFRTFGEHLGTAFQVQDDILGIWGEPDRTGKPAGDDLTAHKKSLPVLLGLADSPTFRTLWQQAEITPESLDSMRLALEDAGALDQTNKIAHQHTELALAGLQAAKPSGDAGEELRRLALALLGRDA